MKTEEFSSVAPLSCKFGADMEECKSLLHMAYIMKLNVVGIRWVKMEGKRNEHLTKLCPEIFQRASLTNAIKTDKSM